MRSCVAEVCEVLIRNEERLNDLDRGSGDGDCGSTLTAGSTGEGDTLLHFHCIYLTAINFCFNQPFLVIVCGRK